MTKREAAIIGAYTGVLLGKFDDMHSYIEEVMGRPVWTHELANEATVDAIKAKSRADFLAIQVL
jgi:hypothetical protein